MKKEYRDIDVIGHNTLKCNSQEAFDWLVSFIKQYKIDSDITDRSYFLDITKVPTSVFSANEEISVSKSIEVDDGKVYLVFKSKKLCEEA